MQPKNLGWKFAGAALLILLAVYAVWAKGLRQGIDLKGGYILTFQVHTGDEGDSRDTVQQVINTLRERIDPTGLSETEWRPIGNNRFEVRMPIGTEASRSAKAAYEEAIRKLEEGNIQPADIRKIRVLSGAERAAAIENIAAGDERRRDLLNKLAVANDAYQAAQKHLAELRERRDVDRKVYEDAQRRRDNLAVNYDEAEQDVLDTNVNVEQLVSTLERYVSRRERERLVPDERRARDTEFRSGLEGLYQEYPDRKTEIDAVVMAYKNWTEVRTGLDDPEDLKRMVAKAGVLEFRIAPTLPMDTTSDALRQTALSQADYERFLDQLAENGPRARSPSDRYQWFLIHGAGGERERFSPNLVIAKYAGKRYMLLYNADGYVMLQDPLDRQWALENAKPSTDSRSGRPAVEFKMDPRGARKMGLMTTDHRGQFMAILLDDEVYSAPVIQSTIYADGQITGDFTRQDVNELVRTLKAGSLDAQVDPNPIREMIIEASLGADNRDKGFRAAVYGLIGVAVFMAIYYLLPGMIANAALMMNLVLVLGAMCFIDAVFTLPGIAGVILTIGMAVDANVLIFERLREEQAKTQSMRMAIRNAYSNAASAILDGNATTLITCLILGWVGNEEIRGFAITLGLGVMFSLFTSLVVTRWIFQLLVEAGWVKDRIAMLAFIGTPNIDWMSKRRVFWAISAAFIALGLFALIGQGRDVLGLEFNAGTQATFRLKHGSAVTASAAGGESRAVIEKAIKDQIAAELERARAELGKLPADSDKRPEAQARIDELARFAGTLKIETIVPADKVKEYLDLFDADGDGAIAAGEWTGGKAEASAFATFDRSGDGKLDRDEIAAIPPRSYQISTLVADPDLVRQAVRNAFGPTLDTPTSVEFDLKKQGLVEALGVALSAAEGAGSSSDSADDGGFTHISSELAGRTAPTVHDRFLNAVGGAMFVIENLRPALTEQALSKRLREMRAQPDYTDLRFTRDTLIGLTTPTPDGAFTSFAVLVKDPDEDYAARPDSWRDWAKDESKLLSEALAREETLTSVQKTGPSVAEQATQMAIVAFVLSWAAIVTYLWLRFGSVRWGLAAVICLIHDVLIAVGMVAATALIARTFLGPILLIDQPFRIDTAVVAAFLTIIGYSVNDTIVVFDRIRENRGRLRTVDENTINRSINQTISRTLLTTGTTLIAVVIMYVAGGEGIHAFTYALLVGIIFGTYSSIAIASPLLLGFKEAMIGTAIVPAGAKA